MNDNDQASQLALSFLGPQNGKMEPSEYFDKYQKLTKTFLALIKERRRNSPETLEIL